MKKKVSWAEVLAMKSPGLGLILGGQPSWPTSGDQLRLCIELIAWGPFCPLMPCLGAEVRFVGASDDDNPLRQAWTSSP
jgi:hypothetical protein